MPIVNLSKSHSETNTYSKLYKKLKTKCYTFNI